MKNPSANNLLIWTGHDSTLIGQKETETKSERKRNWKEIGGEICSQSDVCQC